jgi:hypothetical protein
VAAAEQTKFRDSVDAFDAGINSGVAPILLPRNQLLKATNVTVRGNFAKHRPPYRKINLTLSDPTIKLSNVMFQGACKYTPDFGSDSIMAQIGGRLYQFFPDTEGNATAYDRTIKSYNSGASIFAEVSNTTQAQFYVNLKNINDAATVAYPSGTKINTYPSFLGITSAVGTFSFQAGTNFTTAIYIIPMAAGVKIPINSIVNVSGDGNPTVPWKVVSVNASNNNYQLNYQIPAGTAVFPLLPGAGQVVTLISNPTPPAASLLNNVAQAFTPPVIGTAITIQVSSAFAGLVGSFVTIGIASYQVLSIPPPGNTTANTITIVQSAPVISTNYTFDSNPANLAQAWLWQAENYVVSNNGFSRSVIFDGIQSRRAVTPTFSGSNTTVFLVPQLGQSTVITLNAPFTDSLGMFILVSPLNYFPFLMEVVAINGNTVTAVNITGLSTVNATVLPNSPILSASNPSYSGITISNFVAPPIGLTVNTSIAPNFTGNVGDTLIFTDASGPLTSYQFLVTAITGGSGVTLQNVNANAGLLINIGYPVISQNSPAVELPVGCMGAYVQGRNWIAQPNLKSFIASDLVGSSSGSEQFNNRDAVLKWGQNTAQFPIPGGSGQIDCIVALSAIDASLGQGPLQILCDFNIFTCSAPTDSTLWATTQTPILFESVIGFGGCGQDAAVVVNGDLLFKCQDVNFRSLELTRDDFDQWGKLPISREVIAYLMNENQNLFQFITTATADNRALLGCQPVTSSLGTYCQGLVVIDFDVTSSLRGKQPSVWEGLWTGLNFLKLVTGQFNSVQRTFAFHANTVTNSIELWEILPTGNFDNGNVPIVSSFETPILLRNVKGKDPATLLELQTGEIYLSEIVGEVSVKVWFRPDYDKCWHVWNDEIKICADNLGTDTNPSNSPQYRKRIGLGKPKTNDYDPSTNKPCRIGNFFQCRVEINGCATFNELVADSTISAQQEFAKVGGSR